MASLEQRIAAVMRAVLDYLEKHPNAVDSRRGVEYWVRDLPEAPSPEIVEAALERLVERGEVEARGVAGTVLFGNVNRNRNKNEKT
ncbi:MAG TPA: hypothetical protein VHB46_01950 [Burkholderiales bacterium]|nr:hypothetical protein [Burkholderiales bacterium]